MRPRLALPGVLVAFWALLFALPGAAVPPEDLAFLGSPRAVAPGVSLFRVSDPELLDPPAPLSAWVLRVDPAVAVLRPALAQGHIVGTETVASIAARHGAVAAINAGFFLPNGDPSGILTLDGQLVSEARRPRGAVGIIAGDGGQRLVFGRLTARLALRIHDGRRAGRPVDIAGVDTTRLLGRLMLFTSAYYVHTDTAPGGLEWVIAGSPLRVVSGPHTGGKTAIPEGGFVLSFGGRQRPPALRGLRVGGRVDLETTYDPADGQEDWSRAQHIVGGAGLLVREGRPVESWAIESFASGFAELRHPRTMIGRSRDGDIWLAAVDGRQPGSSAGMTLPELRDFARRLGLSNALNLDGGGSTTMWVAGRVVNSPSDPAGPRPVSDALLVLSRASGS